MPKLWTSTIETHRHQVRTAVVGAAGRLVEERGLTGVTMSGIAELAGIGRATLYKYFADVDAILAAWHDDQVAGQVARLSALGAQPGTAAERLRRVLTAYAEAQRHPDHGAAAGQVALLRARPGAHGPAGALPGVVAGLVAAAAAAGAVRDDVPPAELAAFALAALSGTGAGGAGASPGRLVSLTLDALAPRRGKEA
ncbi:TetR/AcrR family transcriptional regulator [Luteimicrobium sp. NPDC057192]|uniref:TetR/AcrR family transcriptional regulator n=1 Tax=Luteimicrobium sp. NPDC057192 TaxID=3346042 RepID=UPI00363FA9DA